MHLIRAVLPVAALCAAMLGAASAADGTPKTNKEKLVAAEAGLVKMKGTLETALVKLDAAKAENDILKVSCISDQLSAIKGLVKVSEESVGALKEAMGRDEDELVDHQFKKVGLAGVRVEGFGVEVEACMGEASKYTGDTVRETTVDPNIRKDDPSEVGSNEDFVDTGDVLARGPEGAVRLPSVSGSE